MRGVLKNGCGKFKAICISSFLPMLICFILQPPTWMFVCYVQSLARRQSTHCTVEGGPHHWSDTPCIWELPSCFLVCRWKKSETESLKLENLDYLQSSSTDLVLNIALTSKILNSLGGSSEEEKKKSYFQLPDRKTKPYPIGFFFCLSLCLHEEWIFQWESQRKDPPRGCNWKKACLFKITSN